jgi:hypothetical protein
MITTKDFYDYITSLGLFRLQIWEDETAMYAIVNSEPNPNRFTQVKKVPSTDNLYEVRLSKKDYYNDLITHGFFGK